jgi:hypothetical protein
MEAVLQKDPHGGRRPCGYDRAAPLSPKDLEVHAKLVAVGKTMSGGMRGFVYCWPKCKPHHTLSGFRTGQQHFFGTNSLRERWGLALLLHPRRQESKNPVSSLQNPEHAPEVPQPQRLNVTSSGRLHTAPRLPPDRLQSIWRIWLLNRIFATLHSAFAQATSKPPASHHPGTSGLPAGSPHASLKPPTSHPQASLKLPTCTPQATPEPPPCDIKAASERHTSQLSRQPDNAAAAARS